MNFEILLLQSHSEQQVSTLLTHLKFETGKFYERPSAFHHRLQPLLLLLLWLKGVRHVDSIVRSGVSVLPVLVNPLLRCRRLLRMIPTRPWTRDCSTSCTECRCLCPLSATCCAHRGGRRMKATHRGAWRSCRWDAFWKVSDLASRNTVKRVAPLCLAGLTKPCSWLTALQIGRAHV